MKALFRVADVNKDGMVDEDEFLGSDVDTVIELLADTFFFGGLKDPCKRMKTLMQIVPYMRP